MARGSESGVTLRCAGLQGSYNRGREPAIIFCLPWEFNVLMVAVFNLAGRVASFGEDFNTDRPDRKVEEKANPRSEKQREPESTGAEHVIRDMPELRTGDKRKQDSVVRRTHNDGRDMADTCV